MRHEQTYSDLKNLILIKSKWVNYVLLNGFGFSIYYMSILFRLKFYHTSFLGNFSILCMQCLYTCMCYLHNNKQHKKKLWFHAISKGFFEKRISFISLHIFFHYILIFLREQLYMRRRKKLNIEIKTYQLENNNLQKG